jgi:hypothetical protein
MPNVPLAYVSVYRRMSDIFHTLAYVGIRNRACAPVAMEQFCQTTNHYETICAGIII